MKRYLTITIALALFATPAAFAQSQEPCDTTQQKSKLAELVDLHLAQMPKYEETMRQEAIDSGHLYVLDVAGKEVCVLLRDPHEKGVPFQVQLPVEWKPILDGTQPTDATRIIGALREGFDELVAQIKQKNADGEAIARDTEHFQAMGFKVTDQYLGELLAKLQGSGASPGVKAAGERLKAAADARLAQQPNPYTSDEAEVADLKALYGYLVDVKMVNFK